MAEPTNIDAEYMNRWLGENTQIESLSPRTLFDVQTLIEYYRDIIVPTAKITIAFPTQDKQSPRASVTKGEVIIPFYMLKDGRVDETIGAMIHELHHIKLSPTEVFLHTLSFQFLRRMMEQIDCFGMTLAERVFSDSSITVDKILADEKTVGNEIGFLRKVMSDLLFLINSVEDVRIDNNTPKNLKKYIDKADRRHGGRLKEIIQQGGITEDSRDLASIAFMLLVHHKGIHEFDYIKQKYGDTDAIVNAVGTEYPVDVFTAFADEIAQHTLEQYFEFCGKPKQHNPAGPGDDDEFDIDSYFGGKVNHSIGDSLEEQFTSQTKPSHASDREEEEAEALKKAVEKLKNVTPKTPSSTEGAANTNIKIDLSQNQDSSLGGETVEVAMSAEEFKALLEEEKKEVFVAPELVQQIKSFKDVQVYTTTELFNDSLVVYDAVIYDATN